MAQSSIPITQERLKQLLDYNPETGLFTWKIRTSNRVSVGDAAGAKMVVGYWTISIDGKAFLAHRLAFFYMTGAWPIEIDHKDRNGLNNRWENLRNADEHDNKFNKGPQSNSKSGLKGVCWSARDKRWIAQIKADKIKLCKYFKNRDDAASWYAARAAELHGKFARTV